MFLIYERLACISTAINSFEIFLHEVLALIPSKIEVVEIIIQISDIIM